MTTKIDTKKDKTRLGSLSVPLPSQPKAEGDLSKSESTLDPGTHDSFDSAFYNSYVLVHGGFLGSLDTW